MGNALDCKCGTRNLEPPYAPNDSLNPPQIVQISTNHPVAHDSQAEAYAFAEQNKKMHLSPLKPTVAQRVQEDFAANEALPKPKPHPQEQEKVHVEDEDYVAEEEVPINKSCIMETTPAKRSYKGRCTEPTATNSATGYTKRHLFEPSPAIIERSRKQRGISKRRVVRLAKHLGNSSGYFTGILEKYHPGFSLLYVPRECEVTEDYFEYYSVSAQHFKLPLVRLCINDIESVSRVNVYLSQTNRKMARHQFEIIMKPGWSLKKASLRENRPVVPKKPPSRNSAIPRSFSFCPTPEAGHLMVTPLLLARYRNKEVADVSMQQPDNEERVWCVDGVRFRSEREVGMYERYINENEGRLSRVNTEERIETKNPKKWISSLAGLHTWNNRELEWYLAEQRMLFAAQSEEECNKWVLILNWLLWCK